jgi:hypothetical protein
MSTDTLPTGERAHEVLAVRVRPRPAAALYATPILPRASMQSRDSPAARACRASGAWYVSAAFADGRLRCCRRCREEFR